MKDMCVWGKGKDGGGEREGENFKRFKNRIKFDECLDVGRRDSGKKLDLF